MFFTQFQGALCIHTVSFGTNSWKPQWRFLEPPLALLPHGSLLSRILPSNFPLFWDLISVFLRRVSPVCLLGSHASHCSLGCASSEKARTTGLTSSLVSLLGKKDHTHELPVVQSPKTFFDVWLAQLSNCLQWDNVCFLLFHHLRLIVRNYDQAH